MKKLGGVEEQRLLLGRLRVCSLRGVKSLVAAVARDNDVPGL